MQTFLYVRIVNEQIDNYYTLLCMYQAEILTNFSYMYVQVAGSLILVI